MIMQNFGVTNREHYGMLWYFLEWSIVEVIVVRYASLYMTKTMQYYFTHWTNALK